MKTEQNIFEQIYDQAVMPPPSAWSNIARELDSSKEERLTPVITMPPAAPKSIGWVKIAAAACAVGFVSMTALWISERNNKQNNETALATTVPTNNTNDTSKPSLAKNDGIATGTISTDKLIGDEGVKLLPNNDGSSNPNKNNTNDNGYLPNTRQTTNTTIQNTTNNSNSNNNSSTVATNNGSNVTTPINNPPKNIVDVMITDPGNTAGPISVSDKQIGTILNRISVSDDKEELDSIIQRSAYWKQQMNLWRQQLIKSGYAPSSVNYLDIIELKKLADSTSIKKGTQ